MARLPVMRIGVFSTILNTLPAFAWALSSRAQTSSLGPPCQRLLCSTSTVTRSTSGMSVRTMPPHLVPLDSRGIKTFALVGRILRSIPNSLFAPRDNPGKRHPACFARCSNGTFVCSTTPGQKASDLFRVVSLCSCLVCVTVLSSLFSWWIIDFLFGSADADAPLRWKGLFDNGGA